MQNENDIPCGNTIALKDYLAKQEKAEVDWKAIEEILDDLVDDEIMCVQSKDMQTALEFCEDEWYELMEMQDIDVDSAPVKEVATLARLAQTLKNKLEEHLRDELEPKARSRYEDLQVQI